MDISNKMATTNETQFKSGGSIPFSGEEIREAAGFDPDEIEDVGGEDDDDDEE